jgi:hypothetical protein
MMDRKRTDELNVIAKTYDFILWSCHHTGKFPTRADALRDGVLIDVTATAREAGLRWPVALTAAA